MGACPKRGARTEKGGHHIRGRGQRGRRGGTCPQAAAEGGHAPALRREGAGEGGRVDNLLGRAYKPSTGSRRAA